MDFLDNITMAWKCFSYMKRIRSIELLESQCQCQWKWVLIKFVSKLGLTDTFCKSTLEHLKGKP